MTVVVDDEEISVSTKLLRNSCAAFSKALENQAQNPRGKIYISDLDGINISSVTVFEAFIGWLETGRLDLSINGLRAYEDKAELGVDLKLLGDALGIQDLEEAARMALMALDRNQKPLKSREHNNS